MHSHDTPEALQSEIGRQLRAARLGRNLSQLDLAGRAGVSPGALKHLEAGQGATLKTLVCVVRALDRMEWLLAFGVDRGGDAMAATRTAQPRRQRAGKARAVAPPTGIEPISSA